MANRPLKKKINLEGFLPAPDDRTGLFLSPAIQTVSFHNQLIMLSSNRSIQTLESKVCLDVFFFLHGINFVKLFVGCT